MFCTGQGFYILDSIITDIDAAQFSYVGPAINIGYEEALVFDDVDSDGEQVLFSYNKDSSSFLMSDFLPISLSWFYDATRGKIIAHDLINSKLISYDLLKKRVVKKRSIPNGESNASTYAYGYNDNVYFIGTLNNAPSANKPYAFFDFYQINLKRLKTKMTLR